MLFLHGLNARITFPLMAAPPLMNLINVSFASKPEHYTAEVLNKRHVFTENRDCCTLDIRLDDGSAETFEAADELFLDALQEEPLIVCRKEFLFGIRMAYIYR